jgi:hypothetical protein
MRIFFFEQSRHVVENVTYNVHFQIQFSQFKKKQKLNLFRLLITTLSPLEFTIFNSMLSLFAIYFFLLSSTSYLMNL